MSAMQPEPIDPIDAWNALVDLGDFIDLDEAERMFALSPEALAAEVAASGYTLEGKPLDEVPGAAPSGPRLAAPEGTSPVVPAAIVSAPEAVQAHDPEEDASNVVPFAPRRRRLIGLASPLAYVGYAAAAATAGLIAAQALGLFGPKTPTPKTPDPVPSTVPEPPPAPDPLLVAAQMRAQAKEACDRKDWASCLGSLNGAAILDPEGEQAPDVKAMRTAVREWERKVEQERNRKGPK